MIKNLKGTVFRNLSKIIKWETAHLASCRTIFQKRCSIRENGTLRLAVLYGASSIFEKRVSAYRNAAKEAGHDSEKLPVAVATICWVARS